MKQENIFVINKTHIRSKYLIFWAEVLDLHRCIKQLCSIISASPPKKTLKSFDNEMWGEMCMNYVTK